MTINNIRSIPNFTKFKNNNTLDTLKSYCLRFSNILINLGSDVVSFNYVSPYLLLPN